jgi:hypothetical protein
VVSIWIVVLVCHDTVVTNISEEYDATNIFHSLLLSRTLLNAGQISRAV